MTVQALLIRIITLHRLTCAHVSSVPVMFVVIVTTPQRFRGDLELNKTIEMCENLIIYFYSPWPSCSHKRTRSHVLLSTTTLHAKHALQKRLRKGLRAWSADTPPEPVTCSTAQPVAMVA